ncbi:MAG: SMP-30/gluconolactonase/LRE family protein [Bryobacterales bacterium]|nr:SMP-30/gluconolactonase/LRE family protein [Bryobacterales bacterium]
MIRIGVMPRVGCVLTVFAAIGFAQPRLNVPVGLVAVAPLNPPVVYAAPAAGLVRAQILENSNINWKALYLRPAGFRQPSIGQLIVDAADPKVLYAGTDLDDGAVWKTTDGGETWTTMNQGLPVGNGAVTYLMQVPASPKTLYAWVGSEIYKTTNGGESWAVRGTLRPNVVAVAISPSNPAIMYSAQSNGVFRSNAEGATNSWTLGANPFTLPNAVITSLAVDTKDPSLVVVTAAGNASAGGVYFSSNSGDSFNLVRNDAQRASMSGAFFGAWASPTQPGLFWAAASDGSAYRVAPTSQAWASSTVSGSRLYWIAPNPKNPANIWTATGSGTYYVNETNSRWTSGSGVVQPTLSAPSLPYTFRLPPNAQGRLDLPLSVVETDQWVLPVQMAASSDRWLSISNTGATTPAVVQIRIDTAGMDAGTYEGSVRITSAQAANGTVQVPIKLVVAPSAEQREYTAGTLVGTGQAGRFGDGGPARLAGLSNPDSVAVDPDGNILITDAGNSNVRKVNPAGTISRFAGTTEASYTGDDGQAALTALRTPRGIAVDPTSRAAYLVDSGNNRVRRVTPEGDLTTLAVRQGSMRGLAIDSQGNLYVAIPALHVVGRITPDGDITRFAGTGQPGYRSDNVQANLTRLSGPTDVAVDAQGNVYIADTENHRIRVVGKDGRIRTIAGTGVQGYQGEGQAADVALSRPTGVAVDGDGNVFIADTDNQRIRLVAPDGSIRTIAGTGAAGFSGDGGPATQATFRQPVDLALDANGNIYVIDNQNLRVRRLEAPPSPTISGTMVNSGDQTARLAPGSLFTLTGTNFAGATVKAEGGPSLTLGATEVLIEGEAVPLLLVSPAQINGIIPATRTPGEVKVQVVADGVRGRTFTVTLATSAPAWMMLDSSRVIALNEDGQTNSVDHPAMAGSVLKLYATGLGTGTDAVRVLAGEADLEVLSTASAEAMPGVSEIQVRVPVEAPSGDLWLTIRVGDAVGGTATVSVIGADAPPAPPEE